MSMSFSFSSGPTPEGRPDETRPFRMLVIADFSGRGSRGVVEPLGGRRAHKVDLDALDRLPELLGARVRLMGQPVEIEIGSIDDLHPDEIHDKAEVFTALRELRKRIADPRTFEQAAEDVRAWAADAPSPGAQIEAKPAATSTPESEFASLLGGSRGSGSSKEAQSVDALIRQMVAPYIVPDRDPRQDELLSIVEEAIAREMRAVLHCPAWQGVESAWRSLHTLVTGMELDETLELFALDASVEELEADAASLEDLLVTKPVQTAGGVPWALVVHLHHHDGGTLGPLGVLGGLAHRAGAPLLSGVAPPLLGIESFDRSPDPAAWGAVDPAYGTLQDQPVADAICLTAPRFLLRLPYGESTDEIERFPFEEVEARPLHETLLWGNGAVLVALLLGRAFTAAGWAVHPVGGGSIDDLPVLPLDSDRGMLPNAEAWLSDRASAALAERGVTPLVSVLNRGSVQIAGLRAMSGGPLACRWG